MYKQNSQFSQVTIDFSLVFAGIVFSLFSSIFGLVYFGIIFFIRDIFLPFLISAILYDFLYNSGGLPIVTFSVLVVFIFKNLSKFVLKRFFRLVV